MEEKRRREGEEGNGGKRGRQYELQPGKNKFIFCLPPSLFLLGSIYLLCHHYLSPIPPLNLAHILFTLWFLFFSLLFWISSPFCAFFLSSGMVDRDPWVRPAGRGHHAAGQQGETLLPTLGDAWTDGLIEGGKGGSWREVWWELESGDGFWMRLRAGKEMNFICTADWFWKRPTWEGLGQCVGKVTISSND